MIISAALKEYGKIDILVNNAGIIRDNMAHKLHEEEWDLVLNTHLKGTYSCTRLALPSMRARKSGCIINMTSMAGLTGTIGQLNYSAAKAGILGMTWTLALELKNYGINVNAISPAALTDMTAKYIEKAKNTAETIGESFPDYWKVGSPEEVAELVLALCLPQSRAITGTIFSVNGGNIGVWDRPKHHLLASRTTAKWDATEIFDEVLANCKQDMD
ncbi:MAG: SDR family oxidoreductase [Paenibacillaceae bacterium]